ncbi:Txe/YoeB family addiction module toxin [uncultured Imperialibacter sp.]|uniref:Txe/YoeB family addiction module toxin n=1 Tax=uncultured Imperialibacter sp. TaxID=1672639 RepID=UPI0030D81270
MVKAIQVDPFQGIGKPEPLRHNLSGKWSRRINAEHRLIYGVENNLVYVYSLRGHYK